VAPSVVDPNIYFNIYVRGGEDLQFAAPYSIGRKIPFSLQSDIDVGKIADEGLNYATIEPNVESTGESITSVRQLLNRYSVCTHSVDSATFGNCLAYWPYHTGVASMTAVTGVLTSPNYGGDFYSLIAQMYCMYKGSMNVGVIMSPAIASINTAFIEPTQSVVPIVTTGATNPLTPTAWITSTSPSALGLNTFCNNVPSSTSVIRYFQVPYLAKTKASVKLNTAPSSDSTFSERSQPMNLLKIGSLSGVNMTQTTLTRRIGEDFQFCYFVGSVPKLLTYV